MAPVVPASTQTACRIRHLRWGRAAHAVAEARRTALDIARDGPVLLLVTVSVHHGPTGHPCCRAPPPFLRRAASSTDRVVSTAVRSVVQDGMAMRRVAARRARAFWGQPSAGMIRLWCQTYRAGLAVATDAQAWVVAAFAGILWGAEVSPDRLALLRAVDPAAPAGDRLGGDQGDGARFLQRLQGGGSAPDQVITDGSHLYPAVLAQVWPRAAHQRCLFHETRAVATAVQRVERAVRAGMPPLPRARRQAPAAAVVQRQRVPTLRGRPRTHPPPAAATDAAAVTWRWRQAAAAPWVSKSTGCAATGSRGAGSRGRPGSSAARCGGCSPRRPVHTTQRWRWRRMPPRRPTHRSPWPRCRPRRDHPLRGRIGVRSAKSVLISRPAASCWGAGLSISRPRSKHASPPYGRARSGPTRGWRGRS